MKQKILLLLLQAFFALGINAEVFTGSCGANLTYVLDTSTGVLKIDGSGDMYNYTYKNVPWRSQLTYIKTLALSESITSIGNDAFCGCTNLISVNIPNFVTNIGDEAFANCSGLTSVVIPNFVTNIGENAFANCSGLTSVVIPNSVTSIRSAAFSYCTGLISITIPNSVTSIESYVFAGCTGIASVILPNSVTSIGYRAFFGCTGLTSVIIPNSVTSIGHDAFNGCTGLTSFTIPNSVTSIEGSAFQGCSGLTNITIPSSVTSIGDRAFYYCSALTEIVVESSNNYYCSEDNVLFDKAKTALLFCVPTKQGSYIVPSSVMAIEHNAFEGCTGLTSVTIPNSVTSIGNAAFSGSKIKLLNWNANIDGSNVFYIVSSIKEIIIGDDVTTVYPFGTNSSLNKVVLGKRVQYIRQNSFQNFRGDFYIYSEEAPYCYPNVFQNANLAGSTLYVPATKASYYQTTEPWNKFGSIKICPCATPTISIVDGAFKFASETEGAEYHYTITTESNTVTGEGDTATLDDVKLVVSVYATADGYETSETAVQTFSASELGGVSGDTNGDGVLSISDVTSLVDKIIKK